MVNFITKLLKWLPPLGVALLIAGAMMAANDKGFSQTASVLAIAGLVMFLVVFLRGESANVKFYINVAVASVLSLGIIVILYLILAGQNVSWDFSQQQRNSLAPQSVSVVENLREDVRLVAFFPLTGQVPPDLIRDFLKRYTDRSSRMELEMVDPARDNLKVAQYKDRLGAEIYPGDIFVINDASLEAAGQNAEAEDEAAGDEEALDLGATPRFKRVTMPAMAQNPILALESPITNAIVEVTQEKQVKVCVLQGPGFKTLDYAVDKRTTISQLRNNLVQQAMEIEPLQLRGAIPSDCTVLMAAGIENDLFPSEAEVIQEYLDGGGNLLLFFDPPGPQMPPLENWAALLEPYGMELTRQFVVDPAGASNLGDPLVFLTNEFNASHPITRDIQQLRAPFAGVRLIRKVQPEQPGFAVTELVLSSPQSFARSYQELAAPGGIVMPSPEEQSAQPLALASSRTDEIGPKIVAFGNAMAITDDMLNEASFVLATFSINWMAGNTERLQIPAKTLASTPLYVPDSEMQLYFVLLVLAMPAVLFFGGLSYTMMRRRSR